MIHAILEAIGIVAIVTVSLVLVGLWLVASDDKEREKYDFKD